MNDERPSVLFVYYTFTKQTGMVVDAVAEELTARGCAVTKALLEFPDAHYGGRFSKLPMSWPIWHIVGMLPAQRRRKTGEITIPPEAQQGDYDLVVFGSPTWWLTTCTPVRSYLHSPAAKAVLDGHPFAAMSVSRRYYKGNLGDIKQLGERAGGTWAGGTHFVADGNQVMSMASWLVFMRKNEPRRRYLGMPLPRPNLKADYAEQAHRYADDLADKVLSPALAHPVS
ncbi:MAG: flavodoxin family protein [Solirubrobacteraceae bacterium]